MNDLCNVSIKSSPDDFWKDESTPVRYVGDSGRPSRTLTGVNGWFVSSGFCHRVIHVGCGFVDQTT